MEECPDEPDVVNTVLEFLRRDKTEVPSEPAPKRVPKPFDPRANRLKIKAKYEAKYGKPNERNNDEEDESGDDDEDDD